MSDDPYANWFSDDRPGTDALRVIGAYAGHTFSVPMWPSGPPGIAVGPVHHFSYIHRQASGNELNHHEVGPGVHRCGLCGRWVVRGCGRWWEADWQSVLDRADIAVVGE